MFQKGYIPWNKGKKYKCPALSKTLVGNKRSLGRLYTDEQRKQLSEIIKLRYENGYSLSKEARAKISLAHKGKSISEESKKKMSQAKLGKVPPNKRNAMPQEVKLKISASKKGQVAWNKGISFMSGEKHWAWIPDRTQLAKYKNGNEYRNSPAHREWSRSVKNRDCWKCKISNGDCSGRLVAHHILSWREYPELRYQINNGISLCHYHHPRKREEETKLSPYFQELVGKAN